MTATAPTERASSVMLYQALALVVLATVLRLALGATVPLVADEAYYWEWSRRLEFGYFDHPPAIAWLIAAGTRLFGDTPLGVRFFPVLAGAAGCLAIVGIAERLAGAAAARFAALLTAVLPLSAIGLVLATPDAPLFAAIAVTLLCLVMATEPDVAPRSQLGWWLAAGFAIGVAMASKFTGVLVPMAVTLALVVNPRLRPQLRRPGPWLAVLVASAVMLPVLLWNAEHDWIAFRFQLGHGLGTATRGSWWQRELELLGGQVGLATPILFVLLVGAVYRAFAPAEDQRRYLLAQVALFCFLFFVYSATKKPVEANWPAIAWIPAIALLAAAQAGSRTRWERAGAWLAGGLTAIVLLHTVRPFLPIPAPRDPISRTHGWSAVGNLVEANGAFVAASVPALYIAANRYQDAAFLAFHLPSHPAVFALNLQARRNQYDLWPRFREVADSGAALMVLMPARADRSERPALAELRAHFASVERLERIPVLRGSDEITARRLWLLKEWRGSWPDDPTDPLAPAPR
jgi:4-amino-4-deoxy-L-arabinose transferase-like glycosyltransferase